MVDLLDRLKRLEYISKEQVSHVGDAKKRGAEGQSDLKEINAFYDTSRKRQLDVLYGDVVDFLYDHNFTLQTFPKWGPDIVSYKLFTMTDERADEHLHLGRHYAFLLHSEVEKSKFIQSKNDNLDDLVDGICGNEFFRPCKPKITEFILPLGYISINSLLIGTIPEPTPLLYTTTSIGIFCGISLGLIKLFKKTGFLGKIKKNQDFYSKLKKSGKISEYQGLDSIRALVRSVQIKEAVCEAERLDLYDAAEHQMSLLDLGNFKQVGKATFKSELFNRGKGSQMEFHKGKDE